MSKKAKAIIRVSPLNTVGGVVTELGRIYRVARKGDMEIGEFKGLVYGLREIRCALEASDFERRLEELEGNREV